MTRVDHGICCTAYTGNLLGSRFFNTSRRRRVEGVTSPKGVASYSLGLPQAAPRIHRSRVFCGASLNLLIAFL